MTKKKLSEEDIRNWNILTKTLNFKSINNFKKKTSIGIDNQIKYKKELISHNKFLENKIEKKKLIKKNLFNTLNIDEIKIDKGKLSLLKKGRIRPEKILDLHGFKSFEAKRKSIEFIKYNYFLGFRLLLIITGKGKNSTNELFENKNKSGIIKKSLKSWLLESETSSIILGIIPSHKSHGGDGAFYIYLKKNKSL